VGIRTPDLLNAIETRSQLRYTPVIPEQITSTIIPAIIQLAYANVKEMGKSVGMEVRTGASSIQVSYLLSPILVHTGLTCIAAAGYYPY
jgi:hypothetical protein